MEGIEEAVEGLFWKKRRMEYFFQRICMISKQERSFLYNDGVSELGEVRYGVTQGGAWFAKRERSFCVEAAMAMLTGEGVLIWQTDDVICCDGR
jgi:hypothetical protein